ncbi:MAG: nitroreductase family deazaflavin-dependent oxidoreductase [Anaerolineae bacterium]|nr:nitroreductase family deazaflavin-dependent oxidoreductase [Anaerolineae bacterium]
MTIHVFLYRLTGGKVGGKVRGFPLLLLTTTGRKTGKRRTTPLGYFEHEGGYVVIASNAGLETHPAWFHNLRSNPRATVQINEKQLAVDAKTATADKRDLLWARLLELSPSYGYYAKRIKREIPVVTLTPVKI